MIFKDKIVWITGASSGIGEALVYALVKQGAKVVLSARRENELERVANTANLKSDTHLIIPFDLADMSKVADYTQQVISKFGRIDMLINNGGFSQRSLVKDTPFELDRKIMEVNYFSAVALAKSVLPIMLHQRSGQIVVISSIAGKFGFYLRSSYSAAKHALIGFFESLRLETEKEGIKTLIVCPGKIKTNISLAAVKADGNPNNAMDESHANAMSAEQCADLILKAIIANKEEVLIGGKELKAIWLKRHSPSIFSKIIRKQNPF